MAAAASWTQPLTRAMVWRSQAMRASARLPVVTEDMASPKRRDHGTRGELVALGGRDGGQPCFLSPSCVAFTLTRSMVWRSQAMRATARLSVVMEDMASPKRRDHGTGKGSSASVVG